MSSSTTKLTEVKSHKNYQKKLELIQDLKELVISLENSLKNNDKIIASRTIDKYEDFLTAETGISGFVKFKIWLLE